MSNIVYASFRKRTCQQILNQGRMAFNDGVNLGDCIYSENSEEYRWWEEGWFSALADDLATFDLNNNQGR